MASDRKLRWGVISTANIGRAAVNPAIQASANGQLLAVASRDEGRAREFARLAGIPRAYGSYEALLEDTDIDAVYIPLPNSMHGEWTIRAARHGKHILCEKPLGLDQPECLEMEAAAAANGVRLMEAFMYRFHPRIDAATRLIRDGAVGELKLIRSAFTFRLTRPDNIRLDPELGGGALMDVGCYCVNVSRTIFGREPVEAQAFAEWTPSGVDAELYGVLRFGDGLYAQFDCALNCERREVVEIVGTEGRMNLESAFLPGAGETTIDEHHGRRDNRRHVIAGEDEYRLMVEHFADCVLHDRPLRYDATEAGLNMKSIEALYRSARSRGGPVAV